MGGGGRGLSASCESAVLAIQPGWPASPESRVVFAGYGILLLALLDRGEIFRIYRSDRAGDRQRFSSGSDRVSVPALAYFILGRHEIVAIRHQRIVRSCRDRRR